MICCSAAACTFYSSSSSSSGSSPVPVMYHDNGYFDKPRRVLLSACSGLLQIQLMRNALSYEPGELHLSSKVNDGSAGGKAYEDVLKKNLNINYGGLQLQEYFTGVYCCCQYY
jgi:hypothetical protein